MFEEICILYNNHIPYLHYQKIIVWVNINKTKIIFINIITYINI